MTSHSTPASRPAFPAWIRRSEWALSVCGIVLFFAAAALAFTAPRLFWLFPAGLIAAAGFAWAMLSEERRLLTLLFGVTAVIISEPGLQSYEVAYGLYMIGYLAWWYVSRVFVYRRPLGSLVVDRAALALLLGGMILGPFLALAHGTELGLIREDATGFGMLAFYFPIREVVVRMKRGPEIILVLLAWLGLYVATRNFLNFREILLSATEAWQIADARPGYNALQLTTGVIASVGLALAVRTWKMRAVLAITFVICFAALVLIKYRGFWVACLFGIGMLAVSLPARMRRTMIVTTIASIVVGGALVYAVFGSSVFLLLEGTVNRFATLATALTDDISLINRFLEAESAMEEVGASLFVGKGFGTKYSHYSLIFSSTFPRAQIHIGYVSILFKLGVWGTLLTATMWISGAWSGLAIARRATVAPVHGVAGLIVMATLAGMIFSVMTESPWFQANQMFGFAALCALASGLRERYGSAP